MNITRKQLRQYLAVQRSGVTNMFDIRMVCELSGLNKSQVIYIMEHYHDLLFEYNEKSQ